MLEVSSLHKKQTIENLIENTLTVSFPNGEYEDITEENIASESMSLKQSICDESKLKFGGCIAAEINIDIVNSIDRTFTNDLVGKWISVKLTQRFPSGEKLLPSAKLFLGTSLLPGETVAAKEYYLFSGIIDSAKLDKNNRNQRHVVAYDALSMLYDIDATNKLFNLWKTYPNGYKIGELVVLCLNYNGKHMIQVEDNKDILDEVIDQSTGLTVRNFPTYNRAWLEDSNTITYGELLKNCCELLGVFGTIIPNASYGVFRYIELGKSTEKYNFYENLYAEEYDCSGYNKFVFINGYSSRKKKTIEFETLWGDESNSYDLTKNTVCRQEDDGTGGSVVHNVQNLLNGKTGERFYYCSYTPLTATLDGRPWVQIGDGIEIESYVTDSNGDFVYDNVGQPKKEKVKAYVLSRTLSGIKALTDSIEAKGE